jgi:hypothetical protein
VTCVYPGANAKVVADSVAAPIEQQVNGVEHMLYMSSQSTNDGAYNLTITFELGTDLNLAQVLVQNRVALATPQLPPEVQLQGVSVKKRSPSILLAVNVFSPDGRYDDLYLSNYATIQIKDELLRLEGVGDVSFLGQRDYSMRIWLDPEKAAPTRPGRPCPGGSSRPWAAGSRCAWGRGSFRRAWGCRRGPAGSGWPGPPSSPPGRWRAAWPAGSSSGR